MACIQIIFTHEVKEKYICRLAGEVFLRQFIEHVEVDCWTP